MTATPIHTGERGAVVVHADSIVNRCSSSLGVALFSPTESNQMEVFRRADAAMYQAKPTGRNAVRVANGV